MDDHTGRKLPQHTIDHRPPAYAISVPDSSYHTGRELPALSTDSALPCSLALRLVAAYARSVPHIA
eukprot:1541363-Rhodomonas_salina.4